ncbi:MAG: long-chain fatty acid--CoA ligase [Deltaproteobacteria bacterium]|nr:long-chain fatty acid--CoA ligase [Deltaproteobacteria bacterium]
MERKPWQGDRWPQGVPYEISGFDKPVYALLEDAARLYPDATFTIFEGATRTFTQSWDAAQRTAGFLASRGIEKGDRVAMFLPNLPQFPVIFFGILRAGAVAVTCNPLYTARELHKQLLDSGAKALFVMDHPQFYATACEAIAGTGVETLVYANLKAWLPPLKGFLGGLLGKIPKADSHQAGHLSYDQVLKSTPPQPPAVSIDPNQDLALIIYTGGTTGVPKGAALLHRSLVYNSQATEIWVQLPPDKPGGPYQRYRPGGAETFLGVLPWYHSFGLTLCLLNSVRTGSRLVCIPDPRAGKPPFTPVLEAIQNYKCTAVIAVPTIFTAMIHHPLVGNFDLTSIRACGSGGAPLPVEVLRQFEEKTGSIIFEGYGLSETSPVLTVNPTDPETRKVGTVGLPLPDTDIAIVDLDTGTTTLPLGEDGEIAGSGPQVMVGYWNRPDADAEVFREIDGQRYFLTGDIGHLDEDGFLTITDRKKDLILVGGFNAYPREIEEVLYTHPKVQAAAVIGVPDPRSGEKVKAFVQLKAGAEATEEEILEFCRENLTGYKRPREVEFRDQLPVSAVGKVLRRVLRAEEIGKK